jgi:hypothetical protein
LIERYEAKLKQQKKDKKRKAELPEPQESFKLPKKSSKMQQLPSSPSLDSNSSPPPAFSTAERVESNGSLEPLFDMINSPQGSKSGILLCLYCSYSCRL